MTPRSTALMTASHGPAHQLVKLSESRCSGQSASGDCTTPTWGYITRHPGHRTGAGSSGRQLGRSRGRRATGCASYRSSWQRRESHPRSALAPSGFALHTRFVRRLLLVALTLAAGQAEARPGQPAPHDDPAASALWREVIEPHGVEVAALLTRARAAMTKLSASADITAERRLRYAGDAYGLLRRAHQLSPDNTEV